MRCHIRIADAARILFAGSQLAEPQPLIVMKTQAICGAMAFFLGLAVASTPAQTQSTSSSSTTYIETSKFVGKKVKSAQGEEIGTVKDIVLDRNTGCLAYTVVSTTGGGGTHKGGGGKMVAVPWAVFSPSSDLNVLTVTVDRERIYNAPVFDYARIDEYSRPDYITNVYSYYGVSGGGAVGVGVSGGTRTGTSTTTGATTSTGATTATGAAGTSQREGASATPPGTGSPAATPPRTGRTTATPHETPASTPRATEGERTRPTASPSNRTHERGTPPDRSTRGATDTGSTSETERQPRGSHQPENETSTHESRPESEQSGADQSSSAGKTTGTHHKKSTKRETSSPSEQPEQQ